MNTIKKKKKAFTLTELLVVVVVIGVLAAVVLPKYSKVMETRKTTEAESMMAAVRTEQERRCALDKLYIVSVDKLVTARILPSENTKNFSYALNQSGIDATSLGKYDYKLEMPSYADGRICCSGKDCNKLNKDYPTCEELIAKPDYQVTSHCFVQHCDPNDRPADQVIECDECVEVTARAYCNGAEWAYETPSCPTKPSKKSENCDEGTGTKTKEAECIDGAWQYPNDWDTSECQVVEETKITCGSLVEEYGYKNNATGLKNYCADEEKIPNKNYTDEVSSIDKCCTLSDYTSEEWYVYWLEYPEIGNCADGSCDKQILATNFDTTRWQGKQVCVTANECYVEAGDSACGLDYSDFERQSAFNVGVTIHGAFRGNDYCETCQGSSCNGALWERNPSAFNEVPSAHEKVFSGGKFYAKAMREVPTDKLLGLFPIEEIFTNGSYSTASPQCRSYHLGPGDLQGPASCQSYDRILNTEEDRTNVNNAVNSAAGYCGEGAVGGLAQETGGTLYVGFKKKCTNGSEKFDICTETNPVYLLPTVYRRKINKCVKVKND